jgi:hypothetical protein
MTDSILDSVKKNLGIDSEYTAFDPDITTFINGVFSTLNQLGIGPEDGFAIEDNANTWDEFTSGNVKLNNVKTYMYLRVRLLFDPPSTSYLIDAFDKQRLELEWRMNVEREGVSWTDPNPPSPSPPTCWWGDWWN